jgi:hypothetical protein
MHHGLRVGAVGCERIEVALAVFAQDEALGPKARDGDGGEWSCIGARCWHKPRHPRVTRPAPAESPSRFARYRLDR